MSDSFRLCLLGGFRLEKNGAPVKLARQKSKALLAYLALFPGAHTREFLATLFFPDASDADARKNLRVLFAELYKTLGKEFFSDDRDAVELDAEKMWIDANQFARDWRMETKDSISYLQSLVSAYHGDLLPELYDDWVLQKRDELRERYVELLLQVVEHLRAQSEYAQAVEWAQKILAADRANERAHQHLMFLYAAQGDRTAALNQFEACVLALDEELGVEPSAETIALAKKIKQQKTGAPSQATRLTNLPKAVTSFVGREREMEEIREMLGGGRREEGGETRAPLSSLLTLTGPGGSGKTRLAQEIGRALVDEFEHGVWFVDLAPLADASLVPQQIAKALGVQEQANTPLTETLAEFLRVRELLLILDNCEHVIDACAHIAQSLISSSPVSILATSREGLNVGGEQTYPVAPLSVPRANELSLAKRALEFSAVRLFVERARLAQPQFVLDDANAVFVIQICTRLDGIPLALELAAARVKQMAVREIAARLDSRFDLLVGARTALPRQQTLRALIDWSYDLLNDDEKILFRRLSVFAGGWTIESAEEICGDEKLPRATILDTLLRLVDKSLVVRTGEDETRYTMLDTIREYAREKLAATGETNSLRVRHLDSFLHFAEQQVEKYWDERQPAALARTDAELDNLRAALDAALDLENAEPRLRLCGALADYWALHDRLQEGSAYTERALEKAHAGIAPLWLGSGYSAAGIIAWRRGDSEQALAHHQRALECHELAGDTRKLGYALKDLGSIYAQQGDYANGRAVLERAVAYAEQIQDLRLLESALLACGTLEAMNQGDDAMEQAYYERALAVARQRHNLVLAVLLLGNLGCLARRQRDYSRAIALFDESTALAEQTDFLFGQMWICIEKGLALVSQGDIVQAGTLYQKALHYARTSGDKGMMLDGLEALAALEQRRGNAQLAARLYAVSARWRDALHHGREREWQRDYDERIVLAQNELGQARFDAAWLAGQQLTLEQAIDFLAESSV